MLQQPLTKHTNIPYSLWPHLGRILQTHVAILGINMLQKNTTFPLFCGGKARDPPHLLVCTYAPHKIGFPYLFTITTYLCLTLTHPASLKV